MWFNAVPADITFSHSAQNVIKIEMLANASAERLFEVLLTSENQTEWAKGYKKTKWYNQTPFQLGSIRDIHLSWINVRERMLVLEKGKQFSFSSDALTIPIVSKMIEDIHFTNVEGNKTLITWNVYYNLRTYLKPFGGFLKNKMFYQMFYDFAKGLSHYAEQYPTKKI